MALICLVAVPTWAGDSHNSDISFSNSSLVKSTLSVGRTAVEMFATDRVDIASLMEDLDLSGPISPQALADRVNEKRRLLYPDEEIILSITPPPGSRVTAGGQEKASLVKALYWWNNTNCSNCFWFAQYQCAIATLFVDDVKYGAYNIYDKVGNGNWIYRARLNAGDATARSAFGTKMTRGFKGSSAGVASKADVVMYFFN